MSEEVKQEGEFKVKKPSKPKNLGKTEDVTKVEIPSSRSEVDQDVAKVEIKTEEDAVQEQSADASNDTVGQPEDSSDSEEVVEEVRTTDSNEESPISVIEEVSDEEVKPTEEVKEVKQEVVEQKSLPENIEKLVSFMEETGGTVDDYVRLNADYSSVDNNTLVREYYKQTRPHLDYDDVSLLLEDFSYDEELDDEKEIRKKKIAFKEEVGKAKNFLEDLKGKYYDEIKLRPGVTQEQQKAMDFFNRYNEEQSAVKQMHNDFVDRTNNFLTDDFKGFDFTVGDKKFRYGIKNPKQVADAQSDITNFIGKFLDKENKISDLSGYHKALYAARNADTLAQHFYEQGKADAVKDVMAKSKNISTEPRKTSSGEVFVNGLRVKAISGVDSSKLKVKKVTIKK
ncbi:MAG: hypothetical protein GY787_16665 [Alteromonadales bacterium]|nr:hypothetical protein [Alteromonadales bacterium]